MLTTGDLATISMAEGILAGAEMQYIAKGKDIQNLFGIGRLVPINPVSGPVIFQVNAEDAERASILLAELTEE